MINRVILTGRLTKDPELRYTPSGVAVCTFTLAVNRAYTNQQGEREADFIQVVAWRRLAENVANYLRKGSLAGVDGSLRTRSYEGQDGKRVYVTEVFADMVTFLEPAGSRNEERNRNNEQRSSSGGWFGGHSPYDYRPNDDPFYNEGETIDIRDDDLPF
jgi:single-strand DNA-binding protein